VHDKANLAYVLRILWLYVRSAADTPTKFQRRRRRKETERRKQLLRLSLSFILRLDGHKLMITPPAGYPSNVRRSSSAAQHVALQATSRGVKARLCSTLVPCYRFLSATASSLIMAAAQQPVGDRLPDVVT
jgi:hypothetical protein